MAIITRGEKGAPLTHTELDNNFLEIRNALGQTTPSNVSSFQAYIYKRSATVPDSPSGGSYNFLQGAFQEIPYGWFASVPAGTAPIYVSSTLFITSNISAPARAGLWTAPVLFSEGGDGQGSINRSIVYCYKRSAEEPLIDDRPTGDVTVSLSGSNYGQITGPDPLGSGWFKDIQPTNNLPLYLRAATATDVDRDGIDSIETGEWTDPIFFTQDGINARTIFLYARSSGYPIDSVDLVEVNEIPNISLTYNFTGKTITLNGDFSGWSTGIPEYSPNSGYLYVSQATAASSLATDTISGSEFSDAELLLKDGVQGQTSIQYYLSTSSTSLKKSPSNTLFPNSLTFEAFLISGSDRFPYAGGSGFIEYSGFDANNDLLANSGVSGASLTYNNINIDTERIEAYLKPASGSQTVFANLTVPIISDGESAERSAIVYAYKRTGVASILSTDIPPGDVYVSMSGSNFGQITGSSDGGNLPNLGSGWSSNIPDSTDKYLFISTATAFAERSQTSDTLSGTDWSDPVLLTQNPDDPELPLNSATVEIYLRTGLFPNPIPNTTGTIRYTFENGNIEYINPFVSGWTGEIVTSEQDYENLFLFVKKATATSTSGTAILSGEDFGPPKLLTYNGDDPYIFDITTNNSIYRITDGQDASYVGAKTDITSGFVLKGSNDITSDYNISIYQSGGVNGGNFNNNQLDISNFTSLEGYIDLQASPNGISGPTMQKRWSFQIIKDGPSGASGASGAPGQDGQDADSVPINLINIDSLTLQGVQITGLDDAQAGNLGSLYNTISSSTDVSGDYPVLFLSDNNIYRHATTKSRVKLFNYNKLYIYVNKGGTGTNTRWGVNAATDVDLFIEYDLDGNWNNIPGNNTLIGIINDTDLDNNVWTKFFFTIPQAAKNQNGVYLRISSQPNSDSGGDYSDYDAWATSSLFFNTLGDPGPGLVYRGDYEGTSEKYYYSDIRRDVVRYSDVYYITNNPTKDNETNWGQPNIATDDWIQFSDTFESVATKLLLAEDAAITRTLTLGSDSGGTGTLRSANATYTNTQATGYKGTGFYLNSSGDFFVGSGNTDNFEGNYLFFDNNESNLTLKINDLTVGNSNNGSGMVFLQNTYGTAPFNIFDDNILYIGQGVKLSSKPAFTFGGGGTLYNFGELELGTDIIQGQSFTSGNIKLGFSQYTFGNSSDAQPSLYLSGVKFQNSVRHFDYLLTETGTNSVLYQTFGQTGSEGNWSVTQYRNTFTGDNSGQYRLSINSNPENGGIFLTNKENTFNNLVIPSNRGSIDSRNSITSDEFLINNYAVIDFDFPERYDYTGTSGNIDNVYNVTNLQSSTEASIFSNTRVGLLTGAIYGGADSIIQTKNKIYLTGARSGFFYYNLGDNIWGSGITATAGFMSNSLELQYSLNSSNWFDITNINSFTSSGKWIKHDFAISEQAKNSNGVYLRYKSDCFHSTFNGEGPDFAVSNLYIDAFTGANPRKAGAIKFDPNSGEFKIENTDGSPTSLLVSGYKTVAGNTIANGLTDIVPYRTAANTSGNLFFFNGLYVGRS